MGVLIFVALGVYGVMYLFQQRKSSQVEPGTYPHTDHERYEPTREYDEDVDDGVKHVQFADPIEDVANEPERVQPPPPQYVFLDVAKQDFLKDPYVGKIIIQLHPDVVPKTCANFAQLCAEKKYVNTPFHRVIKDFMLQSGDIVHQDGTGTYSIYGGEGSTFEDEAFALKHDRPGVLSMANSWLAKQAFIMPDAQLLIPHHQGEMWRDVSMQPPQLAVWIAEPFACGHA